MLLPLCEIHDSNKYFNNCALIFDLNEMYTNNNNNNNNNNHNQKIHE